MSYASPTLRTTTWDSMAKASHACSRPAVVTASSAVLMARTKYNRLPLLVFGRGWVSRAPIGASPVNLDVTRILVLEEQKILRMAYEHVGLWVVIIEMQNPLLFGSVTHDGLEWVIAANLTTLHQAKGRLDNLPFLSVRDTT